MKQMLREERVVSITVVLLRSQVRRGLNKSTGFSDVEVIGDLSKIFSACIMDITQMHETENGYI